MAELSDLTPTDATSCCSAAAQETCCEPNDKAACCDTAATGATCGCAAGEATADELRDRVRARYAAAARATTDPAVAAGCCGADVATITDAQAELFGAGLYAGGERDELPDTALAASLGCGNPTAMADLRDGMTVLDLGSGGGIDVLLSARRVAPTGTAYGLDMTDEMLDLARANQAKTGLTNVHWLKGRIEAIPLPADTVDVVLSNCVINLSTDKPRVLREAARVLKPGGTLAVSDVIADPDMDEATRADMAAYTGCIAGALTRDAYTEHLAAAGLTDIEITETHRVHAHAGSAIIRARKPDRAIACSLAPDDMGARLALIGELAADGLVDRTPTAAGLRVRLRDTPQIEERTRALIAAESRCCAFLDFSLDREDGALVLEITGPPDARPVIDQFFAPAG